MWHKAEHLFAHAKPDGKKPYEHYKIFERFASSKPMRVLSARMWLPRTCGMCSSATPNRAS